MNGYICSGVKDDCWNLQDSYGEICVGCGCCSEDNETRYLSRLECLHRWKEEAETFDDWSDVPAIAEQQKTNKAADVEYYKKQIAMYANKLEGLYKG